MIEKIYIAKCDLCPNETTHRTPDKTQKKTPKGYRVRVDAVQQAITKESLPSDKSANRWAVVCDACWEKHFAPISSLIWMNKDEIPPIRPIEEP